ncbi:uncharacterized protein LOC106470173 [Limulus polyphemus]|uniref:Uncharacterized protein LOC106470173 n=1 Tax=Limulus polyphemus TaxID=6850 RepID=A0ABM1TF25_LIMPO|nr:uncharacterized protein LOC106470173 [Limulus polyphemus]XP_022254481.1 uncharacterized protein LOC106470173 [Limulus polyphemus]
MPATASASSAGLRVRMRSGCRLPRPLLSRPKTRKSIGATSEDLAAPAFVLVYFPQDKTTTIVPKRKVEGWISPGKKVEIRAGNNKFQGTVIGADDSNEPLELRRAEFEKECFKGNKHIDEEEAVKRFITKRGAIMDEMAQLTDTETDPAVGIKRRKIIYQAKFQGKKTMSEKWNIDSETEELQEPSSTSHQTIQQAFVDAKNDETINEQEEDASLQEENPEKKSLTETSVVEIERNNGSQNSQVTCRNQNISPLTSGNVKESRAASNNGCDNGEGNDQRNVSVQIRRRKRHFMKHIPVRQQYRYLLSSPSSVSTESFRPPCVASCSPVSCQDINHLAKKKQNVHNQSPAQELNNFSSSHAQPASYRAESINAQEHHVISPTSTPQGRTSFSSFKEVPSSSSPYQVTNPPRALGPSISFTPSTSQGSPAAAVHLHCNCGSQFGEVIQELRCIRRYLENIMNDLNKPRNQSLLVVDGQPSHVILNQPQSLNRFQRSNPSLSEPNYQTTELEKQHLRINDCFPVSTNSTLEAEEDLTALIEPSDHYDQEETVVEETANLPSARHQLKEFDNTNEDYNVSQRSHQQNEQGEIVSEAVTQSEFPQNAGVFPLENQHYLSARELEETLSNCNSPQQFAVCIMRKIFTDKERLSGNVNGCGKPRLNPLKIKYIKECIEKFYEFDKNDQTVWKMCVKAIDSANRSFRNRNEVMKRRAAEAVASAIQNTL